MRPTYCRRDRRSRPIERCPSGSYLYALTPDGDDVEPDLPVAIAVTEEEYGIAGPLWVTGGIPVRRADGRRFETRNRVTLCRCGQSEARPLCDGTHRVIGFRESAPAHQQAGQIATLSALVEPRGRCGALRITDDA